jgi:hypothetical protein
VKPTPLRVPRARGNRAAAHRRRPRCKAGGAAGQDKRDYETAAAAEYSNTGHGWCNAVFEAAGVIYDPEVQTCVFE